MRLRAMLCCAVLGLGGTASAAPTPTQLWMARGIEASAKTERLLKTYEKLPERDKVGPLGRKFHWEAGLELAFALVVLDDGKIHVHDADGSDFFHLILNGGSDGQLDVVYVYNPRHQLSAVRIDRLPDGWRVVVFPGVKISADYLLVTTPEGASMFFGLRDPFAPIVDVPHK